MSNVKIKCKNDIKRRKQNKQMLSAELKAALVKHAPELIKYLQNLTIETKEVKEQVNDRVKQPTLESKEIRCDICKNEMKTPWGLSIHKSRWKGECDKPRPKKKKMITK